MNAESNVIEMAGTGENVLLDRLFSGLIEKSNRQVDRVVQPERLTMKNGILRYESKDEETIWTKPNRNMFGQLGGIFKQSVKGLDYLVQMNPEIVDNLFTQLFQAESMKQKGGRTWFFRNYQQEAGQLSDEENPYIGRALLNRKYKIIDNKPIVQAVVELVQDISKKTGLRITPVTQSLNDNGMFLRFVCKDLEVKDPVLKDYITPEGVRSKGGICTGFIIKNSEIGRSQFGIAPRFFEEVCTNGYTWVEEGYFKQHIGQDPIPEGFGISQRSQQLEMDYILSVIRDAVQTYLSEDFIGQTMDKIRHAAQQKIRYPESTMGNICKDLGFNNSQTFDAIATLMSQGGPKDNNLAISQALTYQARSFTGEDRWRVEGWVGRNMSGSWARYDVKKEDPFTQDLNN